MIVGKVQKWRPVRTQPRQQPVQVISYFYLTQIQWLSWKNSESGLLRDGAWTCSLTQHDYPTMHHSLLHPCAGDGQVCCGNSQNAPFLLRYESFFHSKAALLVLAYEVIPSAQTNDGLVLVSAEG